MNNPGSRSSKLFLFTIAAFVVFTFGLARPGFGFQQTPQSQGADAAVQELASQLIAAANLQDRKTILGEHPNFVDARLRQSLVEHGDALTAKGDFEQALKVFAIAGEVSEQIGDQNGVAELANHRGDALLGQGKRDPALESYQQGLALCTTLDTKVCIATSLLGIGNVYSAKHDPQHAIEFLNKALIASQELRDEETIFKALISLGNTYVDQGDYSTALETYQKAMPGSESPGNTRKRALVLRNIALVQRMRGDMDTAIEVNQKSLALYEQLGDKRGANGPSAEIGIIYSQRGNYGLAMQYFLKNLEVFEKLGDQQGIAGALGNVGIVLRLQGNYGLALEYQLKALALKENTGNQVEIARTLNNLGIVYQNNGDYVKSLEVLQRALKLNETVGNKSETASVLNNMGVTYREQGRYDLALESFQKSLQIREQLGEKGVIASVLRSIAIAYEQLRDSQQALIYSERAANLAREVGFKEVLTGALTISGNAYVALGESEKSRAAFEEAISIVEGQRGKVTGSAQDQQRFFEGIVSPYYRMVELMVSQGKSSEALSFAERGKARLLLDVIKGGRVNIDKAMTEPEKNKQKQIRDSLVLLNTRVSVESRRPQPDQAKLKMLNADLESARLDQQDFQTRLYAAHPELQIQRGDVTPFKPQDAALLAPGAGTALLEYVVTDKKTYLFVLTSPQAGSNDSVKVYPIPVKREELTAQVASLRENIASHSLLIREPARRMYDLLLKPAEASIENKTELIIVPDDTLWELPFQALLTQSNHYLIERSAISYAPSFTVLREMIAKRKDHPRVGGTNTLLALGNPALDVSTIERARSTRRDEKLEPLPEAEREVKTLGSLYGSSKSEVFVGSDAREDFAKTESAKFSVLHFATHGVVNNASPMYSHLVLSQGTPKEDGLLEAWELLNMDLHADLVVLSACETARGRVGAGEGMIGLSWALFVAGTPTTVVSQWKVDSASTTELMLDFHRNRLGANSKAQSLRKAMLKLLNSGQFKHPFYWAPFVVIGDAN